MSYTVVFAAQAEDQLAELYGYIEARASPATAERYTDAIVSLCEGLSEFPHRGTPRGRHPAGTADHELQGAYGDCLCC
jgi:plasmid stabilization system protein ParE